MTIENVTDTTDEYNIYSVYDGHEFYRVIMTNDVQVTTQEGDTIKDEDIIKEITEELLDFITKE